MTWLSTNMSLRRHEVLVPVLHLPLHSELGGVRRAELCNTIPTEMVLWCRARRKVSEPTFLRYMEALFGHCTKLKSWNSVLKISTTNRPLLHSSYFNSSNTDILKKMTKVGRGGGGSLEEKYVMYRVTNECVNKAPVTDACVVQISNYIVITFSLFFTYWLT